MSKARFIDPFELIGQPLFRFELIKLAENQWCSFQVYHHLILDGWGAAVLNRSLGEIYTQLESGETPNLSPSPAYTEFIRDDRLYIESETFNKSREYWIQQYPTIPDALLKPQHHGLKEVDSRRSGLEQIKVPRGLYQQLGDLGKQYKVSLFHVLLGALYVYFTNLAIRLPYPWTSCSQPKKSTRKTNRGFIPRPFILSLTLIIL